MKILHIITRLIVGGAQENTLLTCEGLHAKGHDVTLLTGPSPGPEGSLMDRAERGGNAGYKVLVTPHLVRSPHPTHDLAAYNEIKRLVVSAKPDIVHTHSSKAGILGRAAAWKVKQSSPPQSPPSATARANVSSLPNSALRLPLVLHTIHGLPFHPYQNPLARKLWISLERYAAHRCDKIISVADAMTKQALAAKVGRPELFTTIYSAMETDPFLNPGTTRAEVRQKLNIPPTAFVFGTIARLQPLKGHEDILDTAHHLFEKVPDAHLLWIGDGIFRTRFERLLKEKKWTDRVTLTGLVPPTEVPRLLPAMDALVHPSYREGLARALPQALLAGIPIISYDCDGAAEVCLPGRTGILVKTGDSRTLCSAMIGLAHDPNTAAAMGAFGRQFALERFRAQTMVDQIESLYKSLLKITHTSRV